MQKLENLRLTADASKRSLLKKYEKTLQRLKQAEQVVAEGSTDRLSEGGQRQGRGALLMSEGGHSDLEREAIHASRKLDSERSCYQVPLTWVCAEVTLSCCHLRDYAFTPHHVTQPCSHEGIQKHSMSYAPRRL